MSLEAIVGAVAGAGGGLGLGYLLFRRTIKEVVVDFNAKNFEVAITKAYNLVLARSPDPEGFAYWKNEITVQSQSGGRYDLATHPDAAVIWITDFIYAGASELLLLSS